MNLDRRADPRKNQIIKIDVIPHSDNDSRFPIETVTADTSALGIGFFSPELFAVGQELAIIYIPEDSFTTISKDAVVKHVTPQNGQYRIGVEFY